MAQANKASDASAYKAYVEERFDGEVGGEALFRTMADRCTVAEHAQKLRVLQQLEKETKELLAVEVRLLGGAGADSLAPVCSILRNPV